MESEKTTTTTTTSAPSVHLQAAPFVTKTYQMVSDPRTDHLIRWGTHNNSFLVLDSASFSLLLLPVFFKHSNFSSFVRQLNTYGFRKVDPDSWEFAHESFLRGQTRLLPLIVRRKKKTDDKKQAEEDEEDDEGELLIREVGRLRKEQRALEEELQGMNKRLQVTEQRPHQMISFLVKVAEDPELLPRLILSKKQQQKQQQQQVVVEEEEDDEVKKRSRFELPPLPVSSEDNGTEMMISDRNNYGGMEPSSSGDGMNTVVLLPEFGGEDHGSNSNTVAYPFSLLGHVFF